MDVVVAVLKPKQGHASQGYKPQLYEILLLDSKTPPGERVKPAKYLPMFPMKAVEEEPRELVLTQVHRLTGIKGERALLVQWNQELSGSHRESLSQFSLFFVPVSPNDKISKKFVEQAQNNPAFYPLEYVMDVVSNGSVNFPSPTRKLLQQLESWLREKHQRSSTVECMFRPRAEFRIHLTVHNPAFIPSRLAPDTGLGGSSKQPPFRPEIVKMANEALAKMLAIEKCDAGVINPLFGSGLPYKPKPNTYVINQHWPSVPNWESIITKLDKMNIPPQNSTLSHKWQDQFPLHSFAAEGNKTEVEILLKQGYPHSQQDSQMMWAPIHYAAWYGCISVVQTLLSYGASPNLVDGTNGQTALHIAAKKGNEQLARCLLQSPDIDLSIKDKEGKKAVQICNSVVSSKTSGHEQVELLIQDAMKRPSFTVEVHLMDKTSKILKLTAGYQTHVQDLNEQMMKEFNLPSNYSDIFTLWIVSKSLELQLKPDHMVVRELRQWHTRCVNMLTDTKNPAEEEPVLTWRRNVKVSVEREKQIQHPKAVDLLFHEAYHNYIRGSYPCKERDIITFATILFALQHHDAVNVKSTLSNSSQSQLKELIPASVSSQKDWVKQIAKEYPNYKDIPQQQLKAQFLTTCQKLTLYGSAFFTGVLKSSHPHIQCEIGVNDEGIHLIQLQSKQLVFSLSYREISWKHVPEKTMLEVKIIKPREGRTRVQSVKNTLEIRTRQAGLIDHLMQQLFR